MKKCFALILSALLIVPFSSCAAEQKSVLADSCMLYYESNETALFADSKSELPFSEDYKLGNPEGIFLRLSDGREEDLITAAYQDGIALSEATGGRAKKTREHGDFVWEGLRYDTFEIHAENAVLPGLSSSSGGILVLDIAGECSFNNANELQSCVEGFDCVVVTGSGTLKIEVGSGFSFGKRALPLPSLIIDGAEVICNNVVLSSEAMPENTPAFLLRSGSFCIDTLIADAANDICIAGGEFSARLLIADELNIVFRDGLSFVNTFVGDSPEAEPRLVLSGGKAFFGSVLPSCNIEAGDGELVAPTLSEAQKIQIYKGKVIDSAKDGSPFYATPDIEAGWAEADSYDGIAYEFSAAEKINDSVYICGRLYLTDASAKRILPWGGLSLSLHGSNAIGNAEDKEASLAAPAIKIDGDGELTVSGGMTLWASGPMRFPCFCLKNANVSFVGGDEPVVMGGEYGEEGVFSIESGSFRVDGNVWMQNAAATVASGELSVSGDINIEKGSFVLNGGTVTLRNLNLQNGDITINGGTLIVEEGISLENGDFDITAGEVIIPGGEDSIYSPKGTVKLSGGTVTKE